MYFKILIDKMYIPLSSADEIFGNGKSYFCKYRECGMYPVFEVNQRVFPSDTNDWETINRELWVCVYDVE